MTFTATKHHALGNDFLVVFDVADDVDAPALARRWCDRRRGVGADGLLVGAMDDDRIRMILYNADGSRAEMSGNGIRCFAHAVAQRRAGGGRLDLSVQRILTDAGERVVTLRGSEHPLTVEASVDMGPVELLDAPAGWADLGVHPDRPVAHLSLGNPHTVVGVDDVRAVDLAALGAKLPAVNLEIVEPGPDRHAVTMRVHERGVGITEACGTGACAAAWAAAAWGLVAAGTEELVVHMDGGRASVALHNPSPGRVTLTGPATYVATIELPDRT
jgi:diaminopimelate epimerase